MAILESKALTFYYPDQTTPALSDLNVTIQKGEFVVLCGPSGSGKSTFLRHFKNQIAPHGVRSGQLFYNGTDFSELSDLTHAKELGFVFQDPENQMVMEQVREELAFGLENIGMPTSQMRRKLAEMVHALGLEGLLSKKTMDLSGGQKQLVNLASVLLLEPSVLLLDEPTAQLDPVTARDFLQVVQQLNQDYGLTVVMAEHRLEDVLPLADRLIVFDHGQLIYSGQPREVMFEWMAARDQAFQAYIPNLYHLFWQFNEHETLTPHMPLTIKEGRRWLQSLTIEENKPSLPNPDNVQIYNKGNAPLLEAQEVTFQYGKREAVVLDHLSLSIEEGEILAIVGANGSGKSTLLKVLSGLVKSQTGRLLYKGKTLKKWTPKIAYLPQNPKAFFLHDTVEEELHAIAAQFGMPHMTDRIEGYLELFQLQEIKHHHPYDLSGGELQKAALIGVLLGQPDLLLIDEPTKGLDPNMKQRFGEHIQTLQAEGMTIAMVTHDIEFAARYASRCGLLFEGRITAEDTVDDFFKGNTFYTTMLNRLTRNQEGVPEVTTLEEAIRTWTVTSL